MESAKRIVADLKLFARGYTRTRIGLFFSLVFPVILILLFGAIFGGNGGPIDVYVQNKDLGPVGGVFVSALNGTNTIKPTLVDSSIDFKQYLLTHSGSPGILIPSDFSTLYNQKSQVNVTVFSNPADTSSGIILAVVNGVVNGLNLQAACQTPPCTNIVGMNDSPITSQSAKYIDFLVPG